MVELVNRHMNPPIELYLQCVESLTSFCMKFSPSKSEFVKATAA